LAASDWPALVRAASLRGPVRSLAEHCDVATATSSKLDLTLAADKSGFNTERLRERLEAALGKYVGSQVKVRITVGEPERATPAQIREESESARVREAREAIENDPTVRELQAAFDAVLEPESVQPARRGGQE
jgi:DNA polymerase-3 subunit gamma/tau